MNYNRRHKHQKLCKNSNMSVETNLNQLRRVLIIRSRKSKEDETLQTSLAHEYLFNKSEVNHFKITAFIV